MSPEEKTAYAREQILKTAQAASDLEVPVVTGLIGSHVWDKWYVFPSANEKLYEEGVAVFAERWNPILDEFRKYGVKWALEVHPTGIAYTIETAQMALAALDNRSEVGVQLRSFPPRVATHRPGGLHQDLQGRSCTATRRTGSCRRTRSEGPG